MVEGGSTKNYAYTKGMMYDRPDLLHALLDKVADSVTVYLNAQIAPGAQAVMIFDTWGGALTPGQVPGVLAGLHAAGGGGVDP